MWSEDLIPRVHVSVFGPQKNYKIMKWDGVEIKQTHVSVTHVCSLGLKRILLPWYRLKRGAGLSSEPRSAWRSHAKVYVSDVQSKYLWNSIGGRDFIHKCDTINQLIVLSSREYLYRQPEFPTVRAGQVKKKIKNLGINLLPDLIRILSNSMIVHGFKSEHSITNEKWKTIGCSGTHDVL